MNCKLMELCRCVSERDLCPNWEKPMVIQNMTMAELNAALLAMGYSGLDILMATYSHMTYSGLKAIYSIWYEHEGSIDKSNLYVWERDGIIVADF